VTNCVVLEFNELKKWTTSTIGVVSQTICE